MSETENKYPEHEKLKKIQDKSQMIGFFLEWLTGEYRLCQYTDTVNTVYLDVLDDYTAQDDSYDEVMKQAVSNDLYEKGGYLPVPVETPSILAKYFNIDLDKIEKEKQAILLELRGQTNDQR